MKSLILASTSIYRKAQLEQLGLRFECVKPEVDEELTKKSARSILEKAETLAMLKAEVVLAKYPNAVVIGGDQIAALGEETLSKPATREKNIVQLMKLQGREHRLYTSVCVISKGKHLLHTDIAQMFMKPLSEKEITDYVDQDQPWDCAGGYKIEKAGIRLMDKILVEDFTSIQGIGLLQLSKNLKAFGF